MTLGMWVKRMRKPARVNINAVKIAPKKVPFCKKTTLFFVKLYKFKLTIGFAKVPISKPRLEADNDTSIRIARTIKNRQSSGGWSLRKYDVETYVTQNIICIGISDTKKAA